MSIVETPVVAFNFVNRWNPLWVRDPVSFYEILAPIEGGTNVARDRERFDQDFLYHILKNNGSKLRDYVINRYIVVDQKINSKQSTWYLRAVPVNQSKELDLDAVQFIQVRIRSIMSELTKCDPTNPLINPHSNENDLKNMVWYDSLSGAFLSYNKNACSRLIKHFSVLSARHVMDHMENAPNKIVDLYEASVYKK